jgi:hypothetical protein
MATRPAHPQARVINTDLAPIYGGSRRSYKEGRDLRRRCRHRPVQYDAIARLNVLPAGEITNLSFDFFR